MAASMRWPSPYRINWLLITDMTGVFTPCECISFKKYFSFYFSTFHCVKTLTIKKLGRRKGFKMEKMIQFSFNITFYSTARNEHTFQQYFIRWFVCSCVYVLVCLLSFVALEVQTSDVMLLCSTDLPTTFCSACVLSLQKKTPLAILSDTLLLVLCFV